MSKMPDAYPVRFAVEYPDRPLNRLTTAFRIFTVIPIAIVLGTIGATAASGAAERRPPPSPRGERACCFCRRC